MKEIKVSVIVPVYNVEKTLRRCMDSILNQTLKEIEIILVDDGSPDKSGAICDEYKSRYENVHVIHKKNEGLGPTRNAGMAISKGEYIYHCDSDDWVEPNMLEEIYSKAKSNHADAVIFGYKLYTEKNGILKEYGVISAKDATYCNQDDIQHFFIANLQNAYIAQSACNRMLKRAFLEKNQLQFEPFRRCQDVVFSLDLFDKLETLQVVSKHYYNYIIEPGKFKGRSFDEMISIYMDVYHELVNHISKWQKNNPLNAQLLAILYVGHISNYASYYVIHKANKHRLAIVRGLIDNASVQKLFACIKNEDIESRFLKLSYGAMVQKKPLFLFIIFLLHEMKQGLTK